MRLRPSLIYLSAAVATVAVVPALFAHDLFLKLSRYFVEPNSDVRALVLNGTFTTSENAVGRDRLRDLSLVAPSGVLRLDTAAWSAAGDTSVLSIRVGDSGTYVVGASVRARELRLEAKEFNTYLASDGVPDVLAERRRRGELAKAARERYSKHVKAVLQVGSAHTAGVSTPLGYPAELVPLDNPYAVGRGRSARFRALVDGRPVANQLVLTGGRAPDGTRLTTRRFRTDSAGVVRVPLGARGVWYVKFIHMVPVAGDTTVDYESKWATITFAVR